MAFDPLPVPSEPGPGRRPNRPTLLRGAVLAAACVLIATTVFVADQVATPPTAGGPASVDLLPDAGALGPAATADASSEPEAAWTSFVPPDIPPVASLTASKVGPTGIAPTARFALRSLGKVPVATLAKGLTAEPALAFTTARTSDARTLTLVPTSRLTGGSSYRVTLRTPDGAVGGSWFFRVAAPLRIVETHPGPQATGVPTDTGIEITFDQDTPGAIEPFFSISPSIRGSFERHARTWVFVPAARLADGTIYTVTVRKGVPLAGTDQVLDETLTFPFETEAAGATSKPSAARPPLDATFTRDLVEVVPGEAPLLEVLADRTYDSDDKRLPLAAMDLTIHRLAGPVSALDALWRLERAPRWTQASDEGLVSTAGLPVVATVRARIVTVGKDYPDLVSYAALPAPLDRGWYLVVRHRTGRDQQLVLEVTDVSAYAQATTTSSVVWVNDVTAGGPMAGAVVWTDRGTRVAATGPDGLLTTVLPPADAFFVTAPDAGPPTDAIAPGRALVLPLATSAPESAEPPSCREWWWESTDSSSHWSVLGTDRTLFRPTDEIDAWGMVRPRDGAGSAIDVELRVLASTYDCETQAARGARSLVRVPVTPGGRTGTFAVAVPIASLPAGSYLLELWADGIPLRTRSFSVGEIRKPSYTLDVKTDRHVLLEGDAVTATVTSAFFDGTPVPGLTVDLYRGWEGNRTRLTTGEDGVAASTATLGWSRGSGDRSSSDHQTYRVQPVGPEEASTPSISTGFVLYPSRVLLDSDAEISGGTILVSGDAHLLDVAASEARWLATAGERWEVRAGPASGRPIHVVVKDIWYEAVIDGRGYDFIRKRAFDTYSYERKESTLLETDVATAADGTFSIGVDRTVGGVVPINHEYDVEAATTDPEGRSVVSGSWAREAGDWGWLRRWHPGAPALSFVGETEYARGGTMRMDLAWHGAPAPTGGPNSFLFLTASRGLTGAAVSATPRFVHRFGSHDVPQATVAGIWFTGRTYVEAWTEVYLDVASRTLGVTVTPDAARHAPGDSARLTVRTSDPQGRPVASTVILRAVDERLYAIDGATDEDAPSALYAGIDAGLRASYISHRAPEPNPFGSQGGDTMGPGGGGGIPTPRETFRDSALFRRVTTDAAGTASVDFTLPDDVTSWRVSAVAFTADLMVGQARTSIAAGLPMFIEAPVAPEYVVADRPTLLLRAYGTGLSSGRSVTFTVSAPSLRMAPVTVAATAFRPVSVPLPALTRGDHRVTIRARATGSAGGTLTDALVRTFHVVDSRFARTASRYVVLPAKLPQPTGAGMATYTFSDAGRGRYLWPLEELAWGGGDRIDEALGATIARDVLTDSFGIDPSAFAGYSYAMDRYVRPPATPSSDDTGTAGFALFPYGSADLALTARVALLAADQIDAKTAWRMSDISRWLQTIHADPTATRERRNLALAGLAGLDPAFGPEVVTTLATPDLTIRERLYLALAAAVLGDRTSALAAERTLVKASGQELGPWIRLKVGSTRNDILEATSLLALVAVFAGDPIADRAEAYVEEHFSRDDLFDLQKAAFLRAAVARAPAAAARFAYTLGGVRTVVDLGLGQTKRLELAPSQWASFSAVVLSGRVGVTVEWAEPVAPSSVARDPAIALTRTIIPASPVPSGSVVTVVLTPTFGGFTMHGCYRVVDLAPSGLQPLWWAFGGTHGSEDVLPWVISGQKVVFCASSSSSRPPRLVYYARVVTPGTYAWEPALMQAARATESAALTEATRVELR